MKRNFTLLMSAAVLSVAAAASQVPHRALSHELGTLITSRVASDLAFETQERARLEDRAVREANGFKLANPQKTSSSISSAENEVTTVVIYDKPFSFCDEGTEEKPVNIQLNSQRLVPESLIGTANYGFGAVKLMEAGVGTVFVPLNVEVSGQTKWNYIFSPWLHELGVLEVSADIKIANNSAETDQFFVMCCDTFGGFMSDEQAIDNEWKTYNFTVDMSDLGTTIGDYYIQFFAENYADFVMKDLVVKLTVPAVAIPKALPATDYKGTSFTCNWLSARGATSYLLSLVEYDVNKGEIVDVVFENKEVEGTSYTVSGLDPEKVYGYFVAATNGDYITDYGEGVLVNLLTSTPSINVVAVAGKNLQASWEAVPGASYYVASAKRKTAVQAGHDFVFAEANYEDMVNGGTLDDPVQSYYVTEEMPGLPGWHVTAGIQMDGAIGFTYNWMYAIFGETCGIETDDYDFSHLKDGKVTLSFEAASNNGCGIAVGLATNDPKTGEYDLVDEHIIYSLSTEFQPYEITLSGCGAESYFVIVPTDSNTTPNIFFKSIRVDGVFDTTADATLPMGQINSDTTEAKFDIEVIDGDRYGVAVRAFTVNEDGGILRGGDMSEFTYSDAISGIVTIEDETPDAPVRYFNLQGIEVENPSKGIFILVIGNKSTKVVR